MKYAFDNDTRLIEMQIRIHFDDSDVLIINKDNYLISCNVLEELSSDDSSPLGAISSNELEFELYNKDGVFTPTNENSEYFGKIKSKTKVDVFIREKLSNENWISMGVYYISDWKCYQESHSVIVTCNDKMQFILNANTPNVLVNRNISVKNFIELLLLKSGFTTDEFKVDVTLGLQIIDYAYPHSNKLGDVLCEIAKSQLCYIYINRDNVLEVVSMLNFNVIPVTTWSDDDQIIQSKVESSITYNYTSVTVKYVDKRVGDILNLTSISDIDVPVGEFKLDSIVIDDPIFEINGVICDGNAPIIVNSITQSTSELNITLLNNTTTIQENNTITVTGRVIKVDSTLHISKNIPTVTDDRPLNIESEYIDTRNVAEKISSIMYNYIIEDVPFIELCTRGNPHVKIGDVVKIDNETDKIHGEYIVISQMFTFNDSLEAKIRCLNKSILEGDLFNVNS